MQETASTDLIKPIIAAAGFLGSMITLSAMPELTRRQMALAILSGISFAYWGTPILTALLYSNPSISWLPAGGSVEGLVGLLLGMGGIHLVSIFNSLAQTIANDPISFIKKIFNREGGK